MNERRSADRPSRPAPCRLNHKDMSGIISFAAIDAAEPTQPGGYRKPRAEAD